MPAGEIVDINEIIKTWARDYPLERDLKRLAAEDVLNSDINWKHFKVRDSRGYKCVAYNIRT